MDGQKNRLSKGSVVYQIFLRSFTLDGTEQTLVHKLELPADLESFGLRLDLKTPGVFRFEAPDFYIEKKAEK